MRNRLAKGNAFAAWDFAAPTALSKAYQRPFRSPRTGDSTQPAHLSVTPKPISRRRAELVGRARASSFGEACQHRVFFLRLSRNGALRPVPTVFKTGAAGERDLEPAERIMAGCSDRLPDWTCRRVAGCLAATDDGAGRGAFSAKPARTAPLRVPRAQAGTAGRASPPFLRGGCCGPGAAAVDAVSDGGLASARP